MGSNISSTLWIEGGATPEADRPSVEYRVATPSYFQAMGIALRSGRRIDARDEALSAAPVALINETLARRYWPGVCRCGIDFFRRAPARVLVSDPVAKLPDFLRLAHSLRVDEALENVEAIIGSPALDALCDMVSQPQPEQPWRRAG